jgi:ABC-type lipoprotein export system ATPase subunit
MTLIELRGIGLEVQTPVPTRILHPIDLDLSASHSLAIVGPSGAGKTTLASIIGALQPPTEGSLRFAGQEMAGRAVRELAEFRRSHVGFVFQQSHLIDERNTVANVELGIVDPTLTQAERRAVALAALDTVGLASLASRRAAHLSGGERHRVAVARALVKAPSLVIADEPTAALDQENGHGILQLLARVTQLGAALIIVTHDMRAAETTDDVVRIVDGRRV